MSISISGNGSFTGATADYNFDQSVGIAGTLTYEDVTNVDAVGIITAQAGVNVTGGGVAIGTDTFATSDTFLQVTNPAAHTEVVITSKNDSGSLINMGDVDDYNIGRIKYDNSTDSMQFQTNNAERVRINNAGKVGINITNPGGYNSSGNELVLGRTGNDSGMTIVSGTANNGNIFFADGTGANAAIRGVIKYEHANNALAFDTDTTERMRIDSSGNVGIGTDNPGTPLTVKALDNADCISIHGRTADGIANFTFYGNDGATQYGRIQARSTYLHLTASDSTKGAYIDSAGRLLVGTTSSYTCTAMFQGRSDGATNSANLRLAKGSSTPGTTDSLGIISFSDSGSQPAAQIQVNRDGGTWTSGSRTPGAMLFFTAPDSVSGAIERLRIDSSGRLLVGTDTLIDSDQQALIQVSSVGNSAISINRSDATIASGNPLGSISFYADDTVNDPDICARIMVKADGAQSNNDRPSRLMFLTTGSSDGITERARFTSLGFSKFTNTGGYYSVTSPYHEIYSAGSDSDNNQALQIYHAGTNGTQYGLIIRTANDQNDSSRYFLNCAGAGASRAIIYSNGGLANYQSNNSNLCDEREKKNIVSLDSKWDKVKSWELKKFHYNEDADTDDLKYGVIAQQVETLCPEVISDWKKSEGVTRKGVKEQQMMWMAIKALQEAMIKIETLEAKVQVLEGS